MSFFSKDFWRKPVAPLALLLLVLLVASCGSDDDPVAPVANRVPGVLAIDAAGGTPADGAIGVSLAAVLNWNCTDPDGDSLVFTVHFGTDATPPAVSIDQAASSFDPPLDHATTYYWQIVAKDPDGETSTSEIWSFTTGALVPETISAPSAPTGPGTGQVGATLDFTASGAVSSYGLNVEYRCDWGDGSQSNWSATAEFDHSWATEGTYNVTAQARSTATPAVASDWSSATAVVITPLPETINMGFIFHGPTTMGAGEDIEFDITQLPTSSEGHPVEIQFVWGDGTSTAWGTALAATHAWQDAGEYSIDLQARCATHTSVMAVRVDARTVTVAAAETVAAPGYVQGVGDNNASGVDIYVSAASTSTFGHDVEVRIDFGDGAMSDWFPSGSGVDHTWTAGTYDVAAQARCVDHPAIVSDWGPARTATFVENIYCGRTSGPGSGVAGQPVTFTTTETTSTEGHAAEYRFTYTSSGVFYATDWSATPSGDIIFAAAGQYRVHAEARCALHPEVTGRDGIGKFLSISAP